MPRVLRPIVAVAAACLAFSALSCGTGPTGIAPTGVHAVLISLDGLAPRAVNVTNSPTLVRMAKEGAATLQAQTVLPTLTLPSHTSMMTGLTPDRHGIKINDDTSNNFQRVAFPTAFDVARQAGFTSAMFVGKSKLSAIVHNGAPTKLSMPAIGQVWNADTVSARLLAYLSPQNAEPKADMIFIHLPDIDVEGHAHGWDSQQYVAAVKHVDSTVARIWTALRQACGDSLVIIITSDHGGVDRGHSDGGPLARTVPWIAWGKTVSAQTLLVDPIRAVDAGPTLLWVLGITPPADWDGVPVKSAFTSALRGTPR
jgi:predicted AlkP superfamily pyrophosphatase or phosphodiesterase